MLKGFRDIAVQKSTKKIGEEGGLSPQCNNRCLPIIFFSRWVMLYQIGIKLIKVPDLLDIGSEMKYNSYWHQAPRSASSYYISYGRALVSADRVSC